VGIFPNRFEWHHDISAEVKHVDGVGFKQLPFWLMAGMFVSRVDTLAIGYLMNDDAISYLDEIKKAWNAMQFIRHDKVILEFPLMKAKKSEISTELPGEFLQHVVWCELPKKTPDGFEPCGHCDPCKRSPIATCKKDKKEPAKKMIVTASNGSDDDEELDELLQDPTVVSTLRKKLDTLPAGQDPLILTLRGKYFERPER
jgi:hypothetical protein